MKKYTAFDEEIEQYESKNDKVTLGLLVVLVILSIVAIIYRPDVEAIGTWISSHMN